MKKSLAVLGAVIAAGMLSVPTYAASSPSYYISGNVGASWFNDITSTDPTTQLKDNHPLTTTAGINVLGAFGVKWCNTYRLEAEFGYQRNNAKQWTDNSGYDNAMKGNLSVTSVLANGYYDFSSGAVNPYLTAGIGWASVADNNVGKVTSIDYPSESHSVLAYQFGAGISIPVAKNVDIDARYRYFRTSTVSLNDSQGEFQIASHSVLAGLRVGF